MLQYHFCLTTTANDCAPMQQTNLIVCLNYIRTESSQEGFTRWQHEIVQYTDCLS